MFRNVTASILLLAAWVSPSPGQQPDWRVFYPLKVNHRWTYVSSEPKAQADPKKEGAKKKDNDLTRRVVIEVERAEDYARKDMKDGKPIEEKLPGFILKSTSGDKVTRDHVVVMESGVHRAVLNGSAIDPPLLFLKFGLSKTGESWPVDSKTRAGTAIRGTCTIGSATVRVPFRKREPLEAITVTFSNQKTGDDRHEITYWFVQNIGMVKHHVKMSNHESILELVDFTQAK